MTDKEYIKWFERQQIIDSEKENYYRNRKTYTQIELLEIFPEAVDLIPKKIDEWRELRDRHLEMIEEKREILSYMPDDDLYVFTLKAVRKYELSEKLGLTEKNLKRLLHLWDISNNKYKRDFAGLHDGKIENARTFPILQACQRAGINLIKSGSYYKTLCVSHRDTNPSMYFFHDSNSFHCFSCGAHGDVIAFVMKLFNFSFLEAINYLN